jgi:hypothetical protein
VTTVDHLMQIVCIQMVIPFVSHATPTVTPKKLFTLIRCHPMFNSRDRRSASINEESQKKSANNTESIQTETFYASIISMMLAYFADVK